MFYLASNIIGASIRASDGEIGKVSDLLFDDRLWKLRYFVVDTNKWFPSEKVLISPEALSDEHLTDDGVISTGLTKQQIEDSPDLQSDIPVSQQYQVSLHQHFGWAPYWVTPTTITGWPYHDVAIGGTANAMLPRIPAEWEQLARHREANYDSHLRSTEELTGYKIASSDDEEFGSIDDAIVDFHENKWVIVDLVGSSRRWLPGGKNFTCSPLLINAVKSDARTVSVALHKDQITSGPEFNFKEYGKAHREEVVRGYATGLGSHFDHREPERAKADHSIGK